MVKCLYCKIYFCLTKSGKVDFSSKRYQRQLNVNVSSQSRGVSVSVQNINRNDSLCQQKERERHRESMIYWRSYNRALHFTQVLYSRSAELLFCEKQSSSLFGFFLHWFSSVYFKQIGYSAKRPSSLEFFVHWLHLPPFSRTVPLKMTLPFYMWSYPPLILFPYFIRTAILRKHIPYTLGFFRFDDNFGTF